MSTNAIICPRCRRVVALGAELPVSCYGAIPVEERARFRAVELDEDPRAHHECVAIEVNVAEELPAAAQIAEVERTYEPQLSALAGLVKLAEGG